METLKYVLIRQWGFILIALLSIVTSLIVKLPTWWLAIVSIIIIIVNEVMNAKRSHQQKTMQIALRLKELAEDFQGRFINTGSAYSILRLIAELGNTKTEKHEILKEWASGCLLGRDFLEDGLRSLIESLNVIVGHGRSEIKELTKRFEEFRDMNNSYYRLVEAFYSRAKTGNIPVNLENEYNKFVIEYNDLIRSLRDTMDETRKVLDMTIDPKQIDFAKELRIARWG